MGPQQSAKQYYHNLLLLKVFEKCQDKKVKFLWNTVWRSAAFFVCFGLCIKQNKVYVFLFGFFTDILFTFFIPVLGWMDLFFFAVECH